MESEKWKVGKYEKVADFRKRIIDPIFLKQIMKINNYKAIFHLLLDCFIIILAIYLSTRLFSLYEVNFYTVFAYFTSLIIIGARMHALMVIAHDAIHYRFLTHKKCNDVLGYIISWSLFKNFGRRIHLTHHAYVNDTEKDPDYIAFSKVDKYINQSYFRLFLFCLGLLSGVLGVYFFVKDIIYDSKLSIKNKMKDAIVQRENIFLKIAFYGCFFSLIYAYNLWFFFLLYWLVPMFTFFVFSQWIRIFSEHAHIPQFKFYKHPYFAQTRTVVSSCLEKFLFGPNNISYHVEHHIFPSVPFYALSKLHKQLMKNDYYRENIYLCSSYYFVLKDQICHLRS